MRVSLIVAMDRRGIIGADGGLPWHLPGDLKRFKAATLGKPIVMGRRTRESIGRVLPGRENIVLTRDRDYTATGCTVLHDIGAVLAHCAASPEIMVMGGAELYAQFLPRADRIYLTRVDTDAAGDTVFPRWQQLGPPRWQEVERHEYPADEANAHACALTVLERTD